MESSISTKKFQCKSCGITYKFQSNLEIHNLTMHDGNNTSDSDISLSDVSSSTCQPRAKSNRVSRINGLTNRVRAKIEDSAMNSNSHELISSEKYQPTVLFNRVEGSIRYMNDTVYYKNSLPYGAGLGDQHLERFEETVEEKVNADEILSLEYQPTVVLSRFLWIDKLALSVGDLHQHPSIHSGNLPSSSNGDGLESFEDTNGIASIPDDADKVIADFEETLTEGIVNNTRVKSKQCADNIKTTESYECYECYYCSQDFMCKEILTKHIKKHINGREFSCKTCHMSLYSSKLLHKHKNMHSHRSQCEICQKLIYDYRMKSHLKLHNEKKQHLCQLCGIACSSIGNLKAHLKLHSSNRKLFPCIKCGKSFSQKSGLTLHLKTHKAGGSFPCPNCSKIFKQKNNLSSHIHIVHPKVLHQCNGPHYTR